MKESNPPLFQLSLENISVLSELLGSGAAFRAPSSKHCRTPSPNICHRCGWGFKGAVWVETTDRLVENDWITIFLNQSYVSLLEWIKDWGFPNNTLNLLDSLMATGGYVLCGSGGWRLSKPTGVWRVAGLNPPATRCHWGALSKTPSPHTAPWALSLSCPLLIKVMG